jgi:CelD/BcsL family acetyltransferase involved in cellulose biosynthesis
MRGPELQGLTRRARICNQIGRVPLPAWLDDIRYVAAGFSGDRRQNLPHRQTCAAFYRSLVRENLGSGYAVLTALMADDEVVATLLGVRHGSHYVMVRISNAGDKWSNCSPGRLIIERTMAVLHRDGVRHFDFSIGNYAYKRRFGVVPVALAEITVALSWRGWPFALRDRAARMLHRYPKLATRVARVLGRSPSREES